MAAPPGPSSGLRQRHVSAKPESDTVTPGLSDTPPSLLNQAHSPVAALWLESRRLDGSSAAYRPQGEDRPFTYSNAVIAWRILRLIKGKFLLLFLDGQEWRIGVFLGWTAIRGLIPATKMWTSSRMLDLVQASLEAGGVDRNEVIRVALLSVLVPFGEDIVSFLANDNTRLVNTHVNYVLERAYLHAQLSLPIPALSSPYLSSLMYEAGVFAGGESRVSDSRRFGGPFECLSSTFSLINISVTVISQVYLLTKTLSGGSSTLNWSSILLLVLAIAPSFLRIFGSLFRPARDYQERISGMRNRQAEREIKLMGRSGTHKQEIVLFGLKDWVLEKLDAIHWSSVAKRLDQQRGIVAYNIGLKLVEDNVQTGFYVLLALRILPTSLSLGSIRLYQQIAQSLLDSLRQISEICNMVFQTVFYIAAYTEAIDLPKHPHLLRPAAYRDADVLDYEAHRVDGGVGLTAKNLNFRYPGTDKDVLHDVKLTIKPGTTLAIVGFNGGGKTTLVKLLMGLYDHHGTLLLNNRPIQSYDPLTVHRRTSCLFQDFCKYSFTLRENVGIGSVANMGDIAAVSQAIERGGAEVVLDKVGMEGKLNRHGVPDVTGAGGEIQMRENDWEKRVSRSRGARGRTGLVELVPRWLGIAKARDGASVTSSGKRGSATPLTPNSGPQDSVLEKDVRTPVRQPLAVDAVMADIEAEKSASLSGGQWQRVALSRAFMRASEADLVVFDEPSASLDPRAEAQLFERIHALSHQNGRRCTTIYISHRFSTVRKADQIAVVEDGTIVECGPHTELMLRGGRYAELYNLQKAGFDD